MCNFITVLVAIFLCAAFYFYLQHKIETFDNDSEYIDKLLMYKDYQKFCVVCLLLLSSVVPFLLTNIE